MSKRKKVDLNCIPLSARNTIISALLGEESYLVKVKSCGCSYLSTDYGVTWKLKEPCSEHKGEKR